MKLTVLLSSLILVGCKAKPTDSELARFCGVKVQSLVATRTKVKAAPTGIIEKLGDRCRVGKGDNGALFLAKIDFPGAAKH